MTKQQSKPSRRGQVGSLEGISMDGTLNGCADGLQVGGGITEENAEEWLQAGAEKVRLLVVSRLLARSLAR